MKKVLSLVLSLCLFVSLGAGISFDVAEAAATDVHYDFMMTTEVISGKAAMEDHLITGLNSYDKVNAYDTANTSGDWYFYQSERLNASNAADRGSGNNYIGYISATSGIVLTQDNNKFKKDAAYIKIKLDNAGKYIPQFIFANHNGQPRHGMTQLVVYSVNADGTKGSLIASKWINSALYNSGARENVSDVALQFAAGEYIVGWEIYESRVNCAMEGFYMAAADSAVAASLSLGRGEGLYTVKVGEKIEVPLSGKLSTGADLAIATSNGWESLVDTKSVHCRINKSNGTLDITGLAVTSAPETWRIKLGNAIRYFNVQVKAADYVAPDKDYTVNFLKNMGSDSKIRGGQAFLHSMTPWSVPYAATTDGAYGVNRNSYVSSPWAVLSKRNTSGVETANLYFARGEQNYGVYFNDAGTVDIGVLVGTDGKYNPSIEFDNIAGTVTSTAAAVTVSIKSLDGATTYATKTFAAGTATGADLAIADAPVALKEGEYKIEFNKTVAKTTVYIREVNFAYAGGLTYNVALNAGEGTAPAFTYTHGTAATLPAATAPEGYNFAGWYENADFSGAAVTAIAANARGDKTFYAKYTEIPKVYNVTLNANGGTVAADLTSYTGGVGATLPTATKAGYVFGGWYDNADLIGEAVTAIGTDATGDKTFYAKWTLDVAASDFALTASSGYYAYYVSNPNREGVIAISAAFAKFGTVTVEKAGIMIYVAGNENNNAKIARVETATLDAEKFSAIFNGIAKENFDKEVLAKAYVVVDGEYIYSNVLTTAVDGSRWVGVKPKN